MPNTTSNLHVHYIKHSKVRFSFHSAQARLKSKLKSKLKFSFLMLCQTLFWFTLIFTLNTLIDNYQLNYHYTALAYLVIIKKTIYIEIGPATLFAQLVAIKITYSLPTTFCLTSLFFFYKKVFKQKYLVGFCREYLAQGF